MSDPVDLLLITWNRRQYLEKTLARLFEDPTDFRLYCWDNASTDGTADLIASLKDPRVVERHFHRENVKQLEPTFWFLEKGKSDVAGKIDDDVLLPPGWLEIISKMERSESRFGMLGCCLFMEDEWNENGAVNEMAVGGYRVLRTIGIAGQAFLARTEYLKRYASPDVTHGLPLDRLKMTMDGLISGYPLPTLFAHNMDHPRSPMNIYSTQAKWGTEQMALSVRVLGFRDNKQVGDWLRADAHRMLHVPFEEQMQRILLERKIASDKNRIRRKLLRTVKPWLGL